MRPIPLFPLPLDARLAAFVVALLWSLPFLVPTAPDPIPSFDAEWLAAALGLLAVALGAFAWPEARAHWPRIACLPLGFAVLIVAQTVAGLAAHPRLSALGCLYLFWAAGLAWLGAAVRARPDAGRILDGVATAIVVGACLNAVAAIIQMHGVPTALHGFVLPMDDMRPGGNLGQPNHLALQCLIGFASLGLLLVRHGRGRLLAVPAASIAVGLALTGSRAGLLALGFLALFAWRWSRTLDADAARRLRRGVALVAAIVVAVSVAIPQITSGDPLRVSGSAGGEERPTLWRGAGAMFAEAPLTGIGFGRFAGRFFELAPDLPPPHPGVMTTHAHQLPLHVAAEFGLPGLVVLVAGLVFWWRGARRPTGPVAAWACAVALVAGVQSLFEYPLWFAYFLGPVAFALGAAEGPRLEFTGRRVATLVFAAAVVTGAVLLPSLWRDFGFLRAPRAALAALGDAGLRDRLDSMRRESLLAPYVEVGMHRALPPGVAQMPAKLVFSRQVMRFAPLSDVAWRHAGLLAAAGPGHAMEAAAALRRARTSYPGGSAQPPTPNLSGDTP